MLEYRVLGPLTVLVDGRPMKLGGRRQQLVLATLLTHANLTISQDSLIEEVWAGEPPEAARATLQSYVYGLRRELGPDAIVRLGEGYRVDADAESLDAMRFEQLVSEGRRRMGNDAEAATAMLTEALALWKGTPYEGLASNPVLLTEIARLEELHLAAVEVRIEAELMAGNHGSLVGELETLVRHHPLRERFRGQLMLALYGSGRQAEALRAYQQTRLYLAEELGIEPSPELRELEQRILEQDPSLHSLSRGPLGAAPEPDSAYRPLSGYDMRGVIGTGDFGTVYQAYQPAVQREVAIKVIRPEYASQPDFVRRFEQEAQIVAQLDHPHIVPLYDYWRDPEGAYLVMPLMRGGSLESALGQGGWSLPRALPVIEQVCGALSHAHRRGVMHRDVKAANVLLDSDGNAYLSDFGIAQSLGGAGPVEVISSDQNRTEPHQEPGADILALGYLTFQILTGVSPALGWPLPSLPDARPDLPPELGRVLSQATSGDPSTAYGRVEDFFRAFKQAVGADVVVPMVATRDQVLEPIRNPYKGLRAFRDTEADDFFGRDALVDELLGALTRSNVVLVVGPSGSGKSSLVRAGLTPALRGGAVPGSVKWLVTDMFPGSHPFEELEAALLKVAVDRPSNLLAELADPRGLLRITKRILPSEDATLLLLVDQFEELFSTVRSEAARRCFLDNLVTVASDERSKVKVVLTLRADYLDRPLAYHPFAEVVGQGLVTVGPPGREGLAQAIAAPARAAGVDVESGLTGRIIADIENQPGSLPLLQFALTELFDTREGPLLTIAGYEAMGGVRRALGHRAEELYSGLPESMREGCRQIFMRLVSISEDRGPTRRRVSQAELHSLGVDEGTIDQVLGGFGSLRLVSFDREPLTRTPTVELAHEAILEEWPRLREWVADHREALIVARQISGLTRDWVDSGDDPSFLLRGSRLRQTEDWASSTELALTDNESRYIEASLDAERTEDRIVRRRRRLVVYSLAVALGITSLLALAALWQWQTAMREGREVLVRDLSSDSVAAIDQDPELALLLALESAEISLTAGEPLDSSTMNALHSGLQAARLHQVLGYEARQVEFAGQLIVTITPEGAVSANSMLDGERQWTVEEGSRAHQIAASPDGRWLAAAYRSRDSAETSEVVVWDTAGPTEVLTFPSLATVAATSLSWSEDGRTLVALARNKSDAEVSVVDVGSKQVGSFSVGGGYHIVVLPDDTIAVSNPDGGRIDFFGLDGARRGEPLETPGLSPGLLAFDTEGGRLVLGSTDAKWAQAWDLATRQMVWETILPHPGNAAVAMAVSPNAESVAISTGVGPVTLFDLDDGDERLTLRGHLSAVKDLAFDATGSQLVTTTMTERGRMWDVRAGGVDAVGVGSDAPCHLLMSPDGSKVAVTATEGTFTLVDVNAASVLRSVPGQQIDYGHKATVSGDWALMSWRDGQGVARVWDVSTGAAVSELPPCHLPKALSHDGSLLVVEADCNQQFAGSVIESRTGQEIFDLGAGPVWEALFTSAGGSDPSRYVVANRDGVVVIYDLHQREEVAIIEPSAGDVIGPIAVDRGGTRLATGSDRGSASVYDLAELVSGTAAEDALELVEATDSVGGVAVEGAHLAASSYGSLRVWDIATGALLAQPHVEIDTPPFSTFSPDGTSLFYAETGYEVRRLILDPEELVDQARRRLTRDLTQEECETYLGPGQCGQYET